MARNRITCDSCGRPCERVVAKLYLSNHTGLRNDHANYTAHADIGDCCIAKFIGNGTIKWQKRKSNKRTKK